MSNKTTYQQLHPFAHKLQVPHCAPEFMRRIRLHCVLNDIYINEFVVSALTAAMDSANTPKTIKAATKDNKKPAA